MEEERERVSLLPFLSHLCAAADSLLLCLPFPPRHMPKISFGAPSIPFCCRPPMRVLTAPLVLYNIQKQGGIWGSSLALPLALISILLTFGHRPLPSTQGKGICGGEGGN